MKELIIEAPMSDRAMFEARIEECNLALSKTPSISPHRTYVMRGDARSLLGDFPGGISDYNRAIASCPGYAKAYLNRGIAKYQTGDISGSIEDYTIAIQLDSTYHFAYYNLGLSKGKLNKHRSAIQQFDRAIELCLKQSKYYLSRGLSQLEIRDNTAAIINWTGNRNRQKLSRCLLSSRLHIFKIWRSSSGYFRF
jgi:tetratricopeptide (TPR) repeat protein